MLPAILFYQEVVFWDNSLSINRCIDFGSARYFGVLFYQMDKA
jgi:hypothetical protein